MIRTRLDVILDDLTYTCAWIVLFLAGAAVLLVFAPTPRQGMTLVPGGKIGLRAEMARVAP